MSYPKISIVTPSYNQVQYLEETIISVLSQDYPNLEYIIIDGGSTDGSLDIIKKYDKHLAYWVSEADNGHGHALNKGFKKARGDIFGWINSDDKYLPWTFSIISEIFSQHPDINWITGYSSFWDSQGRLFHVWPEYKNIYNFLLGDFAWIQQESVFFRRGLWEKAGGSINEDYRFMIDGELWCRFFEYDELWVCSTVLSGYRIHGTNRAVVYYEECLEEMEIAISQLRNRLSREKLLLSKRLQKIISLKKLFKKFRFPIDSDVILRKIFVTTLSKAQYKIVSYQYDTGRWLKSWKSWSL